MVILLMTMSCCLVFAKPTINYCQTCLSISEFIQDMENNQTNSIMKTNLYKMCLKENDGSNAKVCVFLSTAIHNTLKQIGNDDFCTKINACPSKNEIEKPILINPEKCEFCINLLDSFKSLIVESSLDLVKESFNKFCELTGDFKEECHKNIMKNLDNFIDFVQNKMDSKLFCNITDSCNGQNFDKKFPSIGDLVSLRDPIQIADRLDYLEKQNQLKDTHLINDKSKNLKNPLTCIVCKEFVTLIYSQLKKNATRKEIENIISKSCTIIYVVDKNLEQECESKITEYTDIVISGFVHNISPVVVCLYPCTAFTLLSSDERLRQYEIPKELLQLKSIIKKLDNDKQLIESQMITDGSISKILTKSYKCYFCDEIVQFLFTELNQTKTRQYIRHLLDKSCVVLFRKDDKESICEEYVNAYTDKLINLIEKGSNPGLICNTLHMCLINQELVIEWEEIRLNGAVENQLNKEIPIHSDLNNYRSIMEMDWCGICKKAFPLISDFMQIDEIKDGVKKQAYDICNSKILPMPIEDCKTNVDKLIEIFSIKDADAGCKKLSLCSNSLSVDFKLDLQIIDLLSVDSSIFNTMNLRKFFEKNELKDTECTACKILIKGIYEDLNKIVHSNSTKKFIDNSCEHIHRDDLKEECKRDAYNVLSSLVNDLTHSLPPQQVCELMKYCKEKNEYNDLIVSKPLVKNSACNICKTLFPILHQILQNKNLKDQIRVILVTTCERSNKPDECKKKSIELIDNLSDQKNPNTGCANLCENNFFSSSVFNLISSKGSDDLLSNDDFLKDAEELIPNKDELLSNTNFDNSKKFICDTCNKTMKVIHDFVLSKKDLKEKIIESLIKTCPKNDTKCLDFYPKFVNKFYNMLKKYTNSDIICPVLKLCPNNFGSHKSTNNYFLSTKNLSETTVCKECRSAVQYLTNILNNKTFVDFILKEVEENVCNPLTLIERKACNRFVKEFGPKIIEHFSQKFDKQKICTEELKLCEKEEKSNEYYTFLDNNSIICDNCKRVMHEINHQVLHHVYLKDDIIRILFKTCPKNDKKCREFYSKYINKIYDILVRNTNPDKACPALKLCSNDFELYEPFNNTETITCEECQSSVKHLANALKDGNVVDSIIKSFQIKICNSLNFIDSKSCYRLINQFVPKMIESYVKIDQVCTSDFKACKEERYSSEYPSDDFEFINFVEDPNCEICTRSVEKLRKFKITDQNFKVEEICGQDDMECNQFMLNFQDFFLGNDYNKDKLIACTELDMCLIPGRAQLLGGEKCKYGPAYVCLSIAHSNACNATKFCQQNYWKPIEN